MNNRKITIFDTTLRDGEQAPGYSMTPEEKLRFAEQLQKLRVDVIEAGFAASSAGDSRSIAAISAKITDCAVCSLARAFKSDIDAAASALKGAVRPIIHTFIATSDIHLRYKLSMTRQQVLDRISKMVAYARHRCDTVEFSAEDATRTDPDFLCRAVECAIAAGARVINLPDTVGYATPSEITGMVTGILNRVPGIENAIVSMHVHDDLGLAVANTLAGVMAGASQVECAVCGIGERAGNAALEEVVMGLKTRPDYYRAECNIDTAEIGRTARLLSSLVDIKIPPSKAIVGANAFAHESGIHQHGMMVHSKTYQIMSPESVGVSKNELVLGKHSGRHAFESRVKSLGYHLAPEKLEKLFAGFKHLADRKKTVSDRDIVALAEAMLDVSLDPEKIYSLDSFVVNSGNRMSSTANVVLRRGGKKHQEVALGNGPVYASIRAIEKIIRHPFNLEDYKIQSVTEHRDALGEVTVRISDERGVYRGRGVSTDIIEGSILACLSAVNRMLNDESQEVLPSRSKR